MNQKYFLIFGIIIAIVVVAVILISGYIGPEEEGEKYVITENPVVINKDISGAPSSPMDLVLTISQFSEDKTSEITAKISKREGYPAEGVNWINTNAKINLPEGLKLIEGRSTWQGDIIGDDVKEFKIKVEAVKNGEWIIEANAKYIIDETDWYGDVERFYILVKDDKVLISDRSFTPVSPRARAEPVSEPTPAEDIAGGAAGSGLAQYPPGLKYCKDRPPSKEAVFGEDLTISPDKKKIFFNDKVAVVIDDLPVTIQVSAGSSFSVNNQEFTSAVLSPQKSLIAFTVAGGTHGWGGFKNIYSGLIYPVAFQYSGAVSEPKWNSDGHYVVFSKITPKPESILALVDARELKTYVSEYEEVLSWPDPLPSGILANLRQPYWSEDKDNRVYFSVAFIDTAVDIEHAEIWYIETDSLKWNFYCSLY